MLRFFSKKKDEEIDRSIKKYKKFVHDDLNLGLSLTFNKKTYYPELEKLVHRDITFRVTGKDKSELKYKVGQEVELEFVNGKNGLYSTTVKISGRTSDDYNVYYSGNMVSPIVKTQRRNNYRLSVDMNVSFSLLPNKTQTYMGIARDISSGGMLMESDRFVAKNKKIQLLFELNKHRYNVTGIVVGNRYDEFCGKNIHHIMFDGMGRKDKKELYDYVFNEQRRRIKSGSGRI